MQEPSLQYINDLADGDQSFILEITTLLKSEFPKDLKLFYKRLEENDLKGVASSIHKIKYKFGLLGLEEDVIIASTFENEVVKGSIELLIKFEEILLKINQYLQTL
jgi:HPt (histidine-containing phosphotransfer) domain-containing protein